MDVVVIGLLAIPVVLKCLHLHFYYLLELDKDKGV
jgi:hypothetical protein